MSKTPKVSLFAVIALLWAGCADDLSSDRDFANPDFRLWCGDRACAWEVEAGTVEQVPTWHRKVHGIRLASDGAAISQVINMENVHCVLISLLGNIEGDAALHWEIDYDNDNRASPDVSIPIAAVRWKTAYREAPIPEGCEQARIILRRTGAGDATIAKVELEANRGCAANPPPDSDNDLAKDAGAGCASDGDC